MFFFWGTFHPQGGGPFHTLKRGGGKKKRGGFKKAAGQNPINSNGLDATPPPPHDLAFYPKPPP